MMNRYMSIEEENPSSSNPSTPIDYETYQINMNQRKELKIQ